MENEYITNNDTDDLGEDEILTKLKKAEEELSAVKAQLDEKNKLCLDQTHKIEEMTLENKNLKDENTNLQNLLQFYEDNEEKPNQPNESESKDKEKIKELEIQIMNLEETIKKRMKK